MNLSYLSTFVSVIETGSFTAAATQLNISKPVVSKQISRLEEQLGIRLLNRTTRRLHLTEAGEIYYQHCQEIVKQAKEAEHAVAPLQSLPQGEIRVTTPQCLVLSLLNEALPKFQKKYPDVCIDLSVSGKQVDLVEEGFDLALRMGDLEDSSMMAKRIGQWCFMVYATEKYWKTHGIPNSPLDLKQHNCLIYTDRQLANQWIFKDKSGINANINVKGNLKSNDVHLLIQAALRDEGILFGPSFMFKKFQDEGLLKPALVEFQDNPTSLNAVYPYTDKVSPKVRVFVDFLAKEWQETLNDDVRG